MVNSLCKSRHIRWNHIPDQDSELEIWVDNARARCLATFAREQRQIWLEEKTCLTSQRLFFLNKENPKQKNICELALDGLDEVQSTCWEARKICEFILVARSSVYV